jgi:hypothetical protein
VVAALVEGLTKGLGAQSETLVDVHLCISPALI